jgi:XTP/dITP diphosphohydrolase
MKARFIHDNFAGVDCFADDTGLEVEALGGAPGVYSARYAGGEGHDSAANMAKLLREMQGKTNRRARFRTVIALILNGELSLMEGEVHGTIATEPHGTDGFGYDPIFLPDEGDGLTFAQMSAEQKNAISHRGRAMKKLIEKLNSLG